MNDHGIRSFVAESFKIEGIFLDAFETETQVKATKDFLSTYMLTVNSVCKVASVITPEAELRIKPNMNVRVGLHIPPIGSPNIRRELGEILKKANDGANPWLIHNEYESLHPFMDGNGRSGRLIWLWQMINQVGFRPETRSFLHEFYYQTLEGIRSK